MASSADAGRPVWRPRARFISLLRAFGAPCAILLGTLAIGFLWVPRADALPSFAGQTGLPCSACHVGGFGPQLTPFGISFKVTGYTLGGGTGVWSHVPANFQFEGPAYTNIAVNRPTAPAGWAGQTNNWVTPGCASFVVAGGHSFEGKFGVGGIAIMYVNLTSAFVTGSGQVASIGPGDIKFTKPMTLGSHNLIVALDINNQATISDPYDNNLYSTYGPTFDLQGPTNGISPSGSPKIGSVVKTVDGALLSVFLDNSIYAEGGVYQTMGNSLATALGSSATTNIIAGSAPYLRVADQHAWGNNFLEVGALFMDIPLQYGFGHRQHDAGKRIRRLGTRRQLPADVWARCPRGHGQLPCRDANPGRVLPL